MEKLEQNAILIGLNASNQDETFNSSEETLDELCELLQTAGGECLFKVLQNLKSPNPKTFIGEGKLLEISDLATEYGANMLIFDNELSPSQLRNIEAISGLIVIDRSNLILDIFASRAQSLEGKLQVELAMYKYILPRLSGLGNTLSRQGGGIGAKGPGETKLETDKRHIHTRLTKLKEELLAVTLNREVMRRKRLKSRHKSIALIGYTNAGKSTILNLLAGENIQANNRLFDTLDTTTRKMKVSDTLEVFITDTVGFIRKLPHHLVNAFKATLEETIHADLLVHVVDSSNKEHKVHIKTVLELVEKLGANEIPMITVFNKSDLCENDFVLPENSVKFSAKTKQGLENLLELIAKNLNHGLHHETIIIPYCDGFVMDELFKTSKVEILDYTDEGTKISLECDDVIFKKIEKYLGE